MKKILSALLLIIVGVAACTSRPREDSESLEVMVSGPEPVYYSDWDRAIRADVDMQNMFVDAPTKVEKPIDLYMAMALALKYNYSRRLISYEQSLIQAGKSPAGQLPDIVATAGYSNDTLNSRISPDMKVAWNILDITGMYYQNAVEGLKAGAAAERSRKVIHNIMQETRSLYWQTLAYQKLGPVIDEMVEYMTLDIDELNVKAKQLAQKGGALSADELKRKRQYMDSVKKLLEIKRNMETAEIRLAGLMGFHPTTQYKLVGKEYGNFEIPALKKELSQLEWLALVNRPELRIYDLQTRPEELQIVVKSFRPGEEDRYKKDPNYYNRLWSKQAIRKEQDKDDPGKMVEVVVPPHRYAVFNFDGNTLIASVNKSIKLEEENAKDKLAISLCRDAKDKPFWLIHRLDKITVPVPAPVDIDELNNDLDSLINIQDG